MAMTEIEGRKRDRRDAGKKKKNNRPSELQKGVEIKLPRLLKKRKKTPRKRARVM